ncbi:MAG: outer membrane beta-barrel protein [Afipia sp.]|nr:outer membrane beta-barrel protein [Afipia sp.]
MKKFLLATTILGAAIASASAADMSRPYTKAPVYVAPVYNWTGFYVGAHIGAAFGGNDTVEQVLPAPALFPLSASNRDATFLGGGQIGADYQFAPNWLIGIEGQISGLASSDRTFTSTFSGGVVVNDRSSDWLASVTGRLGYVSGPLLVYAKGGVAFRDDSDISFTVANLATPFIITRETTGWTVGGGLEYMFAPNWSAKIEYQYYDFDRTNFSTVAGSTTPVAFSYKEDLHTVKVGVNYHFNWGGPVVAKY